ncbi:helix-turn-helix domain-containing protein [Limibacter armeniacum]|uniref:helix-turn-helix domain-containing protein n=1 Tax=Limibacter armeniacum TaxID=466084 RepID=UPI002FE679D0
MSANILELRAKVNASGKLTGNAKRLFAYLSAVQKEKTALLNMNFTNSQLAEKLVISISTVQRAIRELVRFGVLAIENPKSWRRKITIRVGEVIEQLKQTLSPQKEKSNPSDNPEQISSGLETLSEEEIIHSSPELVPEHLRKAKLEQAVHLLFDRYLSLVSAEKPFKDAVHSKRFVSKAKAMLQERCKGKPNLIKQVLLRTLKAGSPILLFS